MNPLRPGDQLDHFRIEDQVAQGGMASIFRAWDVENGKRVALKVPHVEVESDVVFFDRFRREEAIGREMDHSGVVKVLESGRGGRTYIALEWVEGRTLRSLLEETGKLDAGRSVQIALSLCEALGYLHREGVVHRDLKPENIMLCPSGGVKLLDFGIAAKAGARRLTFGKLSRIMGTPDYISPEQVRGKRGDARSDLYSLGVILYEMLAGRTPFPGSNPFVVMNARLRARPLPLAEYASDVPPYLTSVISKTLEPDPRMRHETAEDLAHDLRHPIQPKLNQEPSDAKGKVITFSLLAMIPTLLFALLFYVANHQ